MEDDHKLLSVEETPKGQKRWDIETDGPPFPWFSEVPLRQEDKKDVEEEMGVEGYSKDHSGKIIFV